MEMFFQQQVIHLNDPLSPEDIILKINGLLTKEYYFSHLIVDGKEVYDDYEKYLESHFNHIKELEIIVKTEKEFVNDLMISAEDYIEQALPELPSLAEDFYDNPVHATWTRLEQLLGGLQWLNEMLMIIGKSTNVPANWDKYLDVSSRMQEVIPTLAEAIENGDTVLIGDLIQYELIATLQALYNEVTNTIDNEGTRHGLN
ncbi:Uncharacterised protein [Lysinibacillus sphaericus]|nr:Uncharacterised protein [Lysinibacillus sphaericus]